MRVLVTGSDGFLGRAVCRELLEQALERYDEPKPLNLGSGEEVSIEELVDKLLVLNRGSVRWNSDKPDGRVVSGCST